jgi:hypothetical protein
MEPFVEDYGHLPLTAEGSESLQRFYAMVRILCPSAAE